MAPGKLLLLPLTDCFVALFFLFFSSHTKLLLLTAPVIRQIVDLERLPTPTPTFLPAHTTSSTSIKAR